MRFASLPSIACALSVANAATLYSVAPAVPEEARVVGTIVNRGGDVAGIDTADRSLTRTFLYRRGKLEFIGVPSGSTHAVLQDMNDAGHIVGEAYTVGAQSRATPLAAFRAFIYREGKFTTLAIPNAHALGVNDAGHVVGYFMPNAASSQRRAFWHGERLVELPFAREDDAVATKINNLGEITGNYTVNGVTRAFLYREGKIIDLGMLGSSNDGRSGGVDINDVGQVIGYSSYGGVGLRAFIYDHAGMRDLGSLGGVGVTAFAINHDGVVVGTAANQDGRQRAFVYAGGRMLDLNTLIDPEHGRRYELQSATSITDDGVILATGVAVGAGRFASFLLTPVKSPTAEPLPPKPPRARDRPEWARAGGNLQP